MSDLAKQVIKDSGYNFDYPIYESHIEGLIDIAIKKLQPNWVETKYVTQPKEGYYWVIDNGQIKTATVNSLEYAEATEHFGFWQYSDSHHDEQVYPTHFLPYLDGLPKKPIL